MSSQTACKSLLAQQETLFHLKDTAPVPCHDTWIGQTDANFTSDLTFNKCSFSFSQTYPWKNLEARLLAVKWEWLEIITLTQLEYWKGRWGRGYLWGPPARSEALSGSHVQADKHTILHKTLSKFRNSGKRVMCLTMRTVERMASTSKCVFLMPLWVSQVSYRRADMTCRLETPDRQ